MTLEKPKKEPLTPTLSPQMRGEGEAVRPPQANLIMLQISQGVARA
jgi:hypothetical protein